MKKQVLFTLPALAVALVASLTYATSAPSKHPSDGDNPAKKAGPKISKKAKFEGQDVIDTYLSSVRSFMLVPPRDGRFGASRVPTLHGMQSGGIPGYKEIQQFGKKDMAVWSYVAGKMPQEQRDAIMKSYAEYQKSHPDWKPSPTNVSETRVSYVHNVIPESFATADAWRNLYSQVLTTAQSTEQLARSEGYDEYSNSIKIGAYDGWVVAKAVHASEKSCYSCHTEIKEGQPIGYVMAVVIKKGP